MEDVIDLLKPRIKVIAPMPLMKNKVGEFLYRQEDKGRFMFGISTGKETHFFKPEDFKLWPHIFHICFWWEDRDIKEMPEYISFISLTLKEKYYGNKSSDDNFIKARVYRKFVYDEIGYYGQTVLPATAEEYHQNSKKK